MQKLSYIETQVQHPQEPTRHGIKDICQCSNLAKKFRNSQMVFQVVDVKLFEKKQKKSIVGRITLSDGASKMPAMLTEKVLSEMKAKDQMVETYSIWQLTVGKQQMTEVGGRP